VKKESAGVSPVVATILLIAITVVAIGVMLVFILSLPKTAVPMIISVTVDNAISGNTRIRLSHSGGDSLLNASTNIQILINGALENYGAGKQWTATLSNGTDFRIGDVITVTNIDGTNRALNSGDMITMVYIPTSQQIVSYTVP
jgi:flagellin-like protein